MSKEIMANKFELGTAQRPTLACTMLITGFVLAADILAPMAVQPVQEKVRAAVSMPFSKKEMVMAMEKLHEALDDASRFLMSGNVPDECLKNHPFDMVVGVLSRAVNDLKPLRGTEALDAEGEAFVVALAEARRKAERNAHLIRQMTAEPKIIQSNINRDGLIAMARIGREVSLRYQG